jgi:hypothetical protein
VPAARVAWPVYQRWPTAGFSIRFIAPDTVSNFFVQTGAPATLNADLLDTTTSSAGQFAGEVLALRMNVDFSAAGQLGTTSLGNLISVR